MTTSNRTLNRLILVLVALLALAGAALVGWPLVLEGPRPFAIPADTDQMSTWILLGVCAVIAVLAVAWIATRGRGRSRLAVESGDIRIDTSAVASVLRERLSGSPDVAGVRVAGFRRRGTSMLLLTVSARRHPDLTALRAQIEAAISHLDATLGTTLPIVVHVTADVRTAVGGTRTAH